MENENSVLLPHIFQTLSEKPQFCDTYDNLCNELKYVLSAGNLPHREIEKNIQNALNVGQNLGILTLTNDLVRMSFNYDKGKNKTVKKLPTAVKKSKKAASTLKKGMKSVVSASETDQFLMTQPRRIQNRMPTIRELRSKRRKSRSARPVRTRSRSGISRRGPRRRC